MSSLINFSSLEEVLKTVSEQQKAIFDTLEGMRAEVDTLALRTKLEEADNVLEDGCAASPDAAAMCPCTKRTPAAVAGCVTTSVRSNGWRLTPRPLSALSTSCRSSSRRWRRGRRRSRRRCRWNWVR